MGADSIIDLSNTDHQNFDVEYVIMMNKLPLNKPMLTRYFP